MESLGALDRYVREDSGDDAAATGVAGSRYG
jgi:hypothetical protein